MLKHNIVLFFRNIKKNRSTFLINIIGLSTGIAFVMLISLWVTDELNIDTFHENNDRLFQVMKNVSSENGISTFEYTPGLLANALSIEIPEIETAVSVVPPTRFSSKGILSGGDDSIKASGQYIGSDFFDVFTYKFIQGNEKGFFSDKHNIAISNSLAKKLIGTAENAIGKVVEWDHEMLGGKYTIVGVFEDLPSNSTSQFDILFNYNLFLEENPKLKNWANSDPATYIVVKKGTDVTTLENKIVDFIKEKNPNSSESLFLQQYSKKYLYGNYENGKPAGGRIIYIRLFSILGIFLLIIACINFMNLSTATALKRLKEVGVKKAVGANHRTLVFQYLGESFLMVFISSIIAILIVILLLPMFNDLAGKYLSIDFDLNLVLRVLIIILLTGFIAGGYPSLFFSGFNPVAMLKGKISSSNGGVLTRRVMVVFQFAVSIIMMVGVLVVYYQTELVRTKNIGYNRENIIYFEKGSKGDNQESEIYERNLENFLTTIRNTPGVISASNFRHSIVDRQGGTTSVSWPGKSMETSIVFTDYPVGYDFIETLNIEMKEGNSFSKESHSGKSMVVFNETAIKSMGLKDPIGKTVKIWGEDRKIIGVTRDFHFQSFYEEIKPLFFDFSVNPKVSNIIVKIAGRGEKETIERLSKLYMEFSDGLPFEYSFLDKDYQAFYESENRVATLLQYFACMAILISCLGVFGLATFTAERRRKEISIRKVLGQSAAQITFMLSNEFTKLVLSSILIASPIAYFLANHWLSDFAYRIPLRGWFFLGAGLAALLVAMLAVGSQAIQAANRNPVNALRDE